MKRWTRAGAVVDELSWDLKSKKATVVMHSALAQSLVLWSATGAKSVSADDPAGRGPVAQEKEGWRINLPAGRAVKLNCKL